MRLFFAVELPSSVQRALGRLRPGDEKADYRWVDPERMHVTLAFLGDQSEERLVTLEHVGAAAAHASRTGTLALGAPQTFGSRRAPRVVWVGVDGDVEGLRELQENLARRLMENGFAVEDREFNPHITLARRRQTARGGAPSGWPPDIERKRFAMRELTLFESRLSPRGATYVAVGRWPLGG